MQKVGSWVDCPLNKAHKMKMKFWKPWNHPYDFCFLCLDKIQQENKTGAYGARVQMIPTKERRTPEKDSL